MIATKELTAKRHGVLDMTQRKDQAYLDFVTGIRLYNASKISPALRDSYSNAEGSQLKDRSLAGARALLDPMPISQWHRRISRSSQEMNWRRVIDAGQADLTDIERELAEAESRGPGKLVLDPSLEYPAYFAESEFHIQPGSYFRPPLAGYVYYNGTKVFHEGGGRNPEQKKQAMLDSVPLPPDGQVRRILELGCSVGQTTMAWKLRHPQAEVWGIDMGAPMVRFAHKLAVDRGIDVNFAQMAAEHLTFPDNHFDLVYAYILYHEVPVEVGKQIMREALRVLRPGGLYAIMDFSSAQTWNPLAMWFRDFDERDNGEPFATDFCYSDVPSALREAGFIDVTATVMTPHTLRTGVKPTAS